MLERVAMLAARTSRSQAYLQTLATHNLLPRRVFLLGEASRASESPPTGTGPRAWNGVLLPDLSESIEVTCERTGVEVIVSPVVDANASETRQLLAHADADILVYSGVPGQIVSAETLACGPVFLHLHSGWLPDYRGSTTVFYALLDGTEPAVSALLLDPRIDTGPLLARRRYPRPEAGMDVDRLYDSAIRADLLTRVLEVYAQSGRLPDPEAQTQGEGRTYYVIHPVLKHMALLSLVEGRP